MTRTSSMTHKILAAACLLCSGLSLGSCSRITAFVLTNGTTVPISVTYHGLPDSSGCDLHGHYPRLTLPDGLRRLPDGGELVPRGERGLTNLVEDREHCTASFTLHPGQSAAIHVENNLVELPASSLGWHEERVELRDAEQEIQLADFHRANGALYTHVVRQ